VQKGHGRGEGGRGAFKGGGGFSGKVPIVIHTWNK
jgi:hypothetical protein